MGTCDGGTIECAYHGWRFDASEACIEIPALGSNAALSAPAGVAGGHGMIYLAPSDPVTPLPEMVEGGAFGFETGDLPMVTTRGASALLADNFLDMAHFPFVHAGTFGAEEAREVDPYDVVRDGMSTTVEITHSFANREDPVVARGLRPLIQNRRLTYRYTAPFHLALRIDFLDAGGTNAIGFFLFPESAETTRVYSPCGETTSTGMTPG